MSTLEQVKPAPVRTAEGGIRGWLENTRNFFTEVRNETRRVTWPSRREVYATTVVVIVVTVVLACLLGAVDIVLARAVEWLLGGGRKGI